MRNFLVFLGSLLLVAVVLGGLGLVYATLKAPELDRDSRAFVDTAVAEIASAWSEQALMDRASPELALSLGQGVLQRRFARLRQLGPLQDYQGAGGDASIALTRKGITVTALYFARASFNAGDAVFRVALSREQGRWLIDEFRVESEALAIARSAPQSSASPGGANAPDADLEAYGAGVEGFNRWCRAALSAISVRYLSASEVWIAMSDTYGPFPNRALAARTAAKYLAFDSSVSSVKVVLFRSNQRLADATVNRE